MVYSLMMGHVNKVMQLKIAFSGAMGTGKDSAVAYLINKYGGTKVAFADPLYEIMYYAQKVCRFRPTKDREFLQWIGTDWGRKREEGVWVRLAMEKANSTDDNVYISDIRFPDELQAAKDNGFLCVKLTRSTVESDRVGSGSLTHASETNLNTMQGWDLTIENDGTLEEFHEKIEGLVFGKTLATING